MKYSLLSFFCFFNQLNIAIAQHKSGVNFVKYFQNSLKSISKKVYLAGINGEIKAYYTDSLASVKTESDLRLIGSTLVQAFGSNGTDTIYFNADSISPDLPFTYDLQIGNNGSITLLPRSIALIQTQIFQNHFLFHNVLFFADYNEVISKILNPNEVAFLKNYSQFKFYETNFNYSDKKEDLKINWVDLTYQQHYRTGTLVSSEVLGEFVYEHLKSTLFESFNKNKILLKGVDLKPMSNSEFTKMHIQDLPFSIGDPDEDYREGKDTIIDHTIYSGWFPNAKYIDTVLPVLPIAFDSISFGKINNKPTLFISQLNSNSKTYSTYHIALSDAQRVLYPGIFNWIDLYFKTEWID